MAGRDRRGQRVNNYDTQEGITEAVKTLSGLRVLAKARMQAGYTRKERLSEWCVLGRLHMDTCGNTMPITEGIDDRTARELPAALSWKELFRHLPLGASVISSMQHAIPEEGAECSRCFEGWDINNWHTARAVRLVRLEINDSHEWLHETCLRFRAYDRAREQMERIFTKAGFYDFRLISVSNGYWNDKGTEPWFRVETPELGSGRWLLVGWRKRVINIDWEKAGLLATPDFSSENVTVGTSYVHAWGEEKAVEYLQKIRACRPLRR